LLALSHPIKCQFYCHDIYAGKLDSSLRISWDHRLLIREGTQIRPGKTRHPLAVTETGNYPIMI